MRSVRALLCAAMVLALSAGTALAGDSVNMKPGKWEISTTMQMPGMPAGMSGMSMTHTQCLKGDDPIPEDPNPAQQGKCETQDVQVKGDTVSWKIVCNSDQGKMTSIGWITYKGTTFNGEVKAQIPGQNMEMTSVMKGRRIGECD